MKFRRKVVHDVEINLTPLIDCLLFILVFLLLTTTFYEKSRINLTLPDAQGVPERQYDRKIEVIIDAKGHYTVNGQSVPTQDISDISSAIKKAAEGKHDAMFVITADAQSTHQDVIRVMDVAGQLGFVNINISTKMPT